jgi:hypothetical protein
MAGSRGEEAWAAVSALRIDGSREVFEYAAVWCHADDPLQRARGAAIRHLGPGSSRQPESYPDKSSAIRIIQTRTFALPWPWLGAAYPNDPRSVRGLVKLTMEIAKLCFVA